MAYVTLNRQTTHRSCLQPFRQSVLGHGSQPFFLLTRLLLIHQAKESLSKETAEIINEHLSVDGDFLELRQDQAGENLRDHLAADGISAIIFNRQGKAVKTFGFLGTTGLDFLIPAAAVRSVSAPDKTRPNPIFSLKKLEGKPYLAAGSTLRSGSQSIGSLFLAKPLEELELFSQIFFTVFLVLAAASVVGSFALGYWLAQKALLPINRLIATVEKIDLHRLNRIAPLPGHPRDEIFLLAQKFNAMISRLQTTAQQQQDFITNASHELKTPLTRVISSLELAQNRKRLPKLAQAIKDLFDLSGLVDQLLEISRPAGGKPTRNTTLLSSIASKLESHFASQLAKKKIKLELKIPAGLKLPLPAKELWLILVNLVGNAVKFSPENNVIILAAQTGDRPILEVKDFGPGIDKKDRQRLFDRFYRGKSGRALPGHGIGLSLVKHLCRIYGIKITFMPNRSKGTIVRLIFHGAKS